MIAGWQEAATTDADTIVRWWSERSNANVGIQTGLINNLVMIDLDGPEAHSWWASQGFPDGAMVRTPRANGGTHHYFRVYDVEIKSSKSEIGPGVDVRGEGGLGVGPGSLLPTGTYVGDLSNIPDAPDELIALLPEKQTYESVQWEGETVDSASPDEERQIGHIVEWLQALPKVWAEGAGWHETVYRSACWLSRMVNSGAYALDEDTARQIMLGNAPTYPGWGPEKIIEQWESARKSTVGQFADLPKAAIPEMLPFLDVANALPPRMSNGYPFADFVFGVPDVKSPGAIREYRRVLMVEAMMAGMTEQQTASLAWGAKVSEILQINPDGVRELWRELEEAKKGVTQADTTLAPVTPIHPVAQQTSSGRIDLLTAEERALFNTGELRWWGDRYLEWAASRVAMMNGPYHRMNRWTILSLVFSDSAYIPKKKGPMNLALFMMVLGATTTGKTEALEIMRSVIRACFPPGDSPNIGGDASPNALIEKLIERNGKASWFNADEAHGLFKEMQGTTWRAGLREKWTELYEGRVPMMLRNGNKDVSGVDAITFFTMYLMGTTEGMVDVLDAEFWTSGFLARFIWAIGENPAPSEDSMVEDQEEADDVQKAYDAMPKQWASEFREAKTRLGASPMSPVKMKMDPDALQRHTQFKIGMTRMFEGHRQHDLIRPTLIRFANSVRKCATLVALTEASPTVQLRHEIIALEQAEEWLTNILVIINATTESAFSRHVDDLERFIAAQRDSQAAASAIYSHFRVPKWETDKYIDQLVAENRIFKVPSADDSKRTFKIKEAYAA
jgi:hypothetical protein